MKLSSGFEHRTFESKVGPLTLEKLPVIPNIFVAKARGRGLTDKSDDLTHSRPTPTPTNFAVGMINSACIATSQLHGSK